jgi:DNA-binding beta-propeller fold protein YncE
MRVSVSLMLEVWVAVLAAVMAKGQQTPVPPAPTATPSHPFFITKTWVIGGAGDWDYLTMDPTTRELFIAHGPMVQVVDVDSGTVAGSVKGFRQAHSVLLDGQGVYGYATDGQADVVRIFDRRSFQVVAIIPTGPSPRSMALDAPSGLLFVIGGQPSRPGAVAQQELAGRQAGVAASRSRAAERPGVATPHGTQSSVTVVDIARRVQLAQLVLPGELGFAQADGDGRVYITVRDSNQILRLDAQAVGNALHRIIDVPANAPIEKRSTQSVQTENTSARPAKPPVLDWYRGAATNPPAEALPAALSLGSACDGPRALAIDRNHVRLFAACSNFRMVVIDPQRAGVIAALPIGPGPDAIAYDANRGLIFTANGAGDGSLTIIRQDVTDTYSVIQTLPTRQHARTLAVDPSSGNVYLTSVLYGAAMDTPMTNGRPAPLKVARVDSSFQVLVVGN